MSVMDSMEIQLILPHRYPFLLVDRIRELDPDRRIVGIKNVSINEPFFQGHFPGRPVMPGVLILEALAQVGGVLAFKSFGSVGRPVVYLTGIDASQVQEARRARRYPPTGSGRHKKAPALLENARQSLRRHRAGV